MKTTTVAGETKKKWKKTLEIQFRWKVEKLATD